MITAEWVRRTLSERSPWWRLSPDNFRLAVWLLGACEVRQGSPRLEVRADDLAHFHRISRAKLRRALEALEESGFCRVWGQRGRGGLTQIVLSDGRPFGIVAPPVLLQAGTILESSEPESRDGHQTERIDHYRSNPDIIPEGGRPAINPDHLAISQVAETTDLPDLDLLRSSEDPDLRSDLRSPTSRDQSNTTVDEHSGVAIWAEEIPEPTHGEPTPRIAVDKIPDRAFAAADYLRAAVLTENQAAVVGSVPWDQDAKSGRRLSWADSFRRLHTRVLKAMRNETRSTTDSEAWKEIARTVHWVYHGQPADRRYRFEVESPDTLGEKWDRIQVQRKRQKQDADQPKPARSADGRPDPQANRVFKKLG